MNSSHFWALLVGINIGCFLNNLHFNLKSSDTLYLIVAFLCTLSMIKKIKSTKEEDDDDDEEFFL